jgi:hypothetical protein
MSDDEDWAMGGVSTFQSVEPDPLLLSYELLPKHPHISNELG